MLHIRERLSVPIICPLQTNLKLQRRIANSVVFLWMAKRRSFRQWYDVENHWSFTFNLWHKVDWWCNIMGTSSWEESTEWWTVATFCRCFFLTSYTQNWIPSLVHMEVPKVQIIFSLPYSLILSGFCRHGIVQKMACENAGNSEVGASIVLTDSCIGNKMVMRRHVRNT